MDAIGKAATAIARADAILIGASNGLSIAEGYHIFAHNEMFHRQFGDYWQRFGIRNVLEGCFFRYPHEATAGSSCAACSSIGWLITAFRQ